MPWWAIIYLTVFIAFSFVADTLGASDSTSRFQWIADTLSGAVFAILFAGFWLPSVFRILGLAAPVLFVAAVAWEVYSSPGDLREIWSNTKLSRSERLGLVLAAPLLVWPLYIIAGVGVFFHPRT